MVEQCDPCRLGAHRLCDPDREWCECGFGPNDTADGWVLLPCLTPIPDRED